MVGRRAAIKVYSIQLTGSFGNIQRKLIGAFDRRWFE
jgi:hypothetical protein